MARGDRPPVGPVFDHRERRVRVADDVIGRRIEWLDQLAASLRADAQSATSAGGDLRTARSRAAQRARSGGDPEPERERAVQRVASRPRQLRPPSDRRARRRREAKAFARVPPPPPPCPRSRTPSCRRPHRRSSSSCRDRTVRFLKRSIDPGRMIARPSFRPPPSSRFRLGQPKPAVGPLSSK